MEELRKILAAHAERYPLLQPQDAVKLIYQNEFGCGHLLQDKRRAYDFFWQELAATPCDPSLPLFEEIGNGLIRVNLAAKDESGYQVSDLFADFAATAERHRGTTDAFIKKLDILRDAVSEGRFGFTPAELEEYLSGYAAKGYPMVSHSRIFHDAYRPAYRVILRSLAEKSMKKLRIAAQKTLFS